MFAGCCTGMSSPPCRKTSETEAALDDAARTGTPTTLAGIIVEPLVQGAGGMRFHDPEVLRRLRRSPIASMLLLIFDEIFTGFGRTGTMFACEAAGVVPDIITLSKALTGGTLPLAATVARRRVFDSFWSDDPMAALMHGPTYMANALACAAANASLDLFEDGERLPQVARIERWLAARSRAMPRSAGRDRCPDARRHRRGRARADRRSRMRCAARSWRRARSSGRSAT